MVFNKRHRPTALLYTDSRGINIPNKFFYPYYSDKLSKYINVKKFICPHKWTTTLDFLYMYKKIFSKNLKEDMIGYRYLSDIGFITNTTKIIKGNLDFETNDMFLLIDKKFIKCNKHII